MTFEEYVPLALKTESISPFYNNDPANSRKLHAALGLVTECGELLDIVKKHWCYGKPVDPVHCREELGDLCWYLAVYADACGLLNVQGVFDLEGDVQLQTDHLQQQFMAQSTSLMHLSFTLLGRMGSARNPQVTAATIWSHIQRVAKYTDAGTMSDILETNIAKLKRRHGAKFSAETDVERDLVAEREVLAFGKFSTQKPACFADPSAYADNHLECNACLVRGACKYQIDQKRGRVAAQQPEKA